MMTARLAVFLTVLSSAALIGTGQAAQLSEPFIVGVWGGNDAVIPFAEFDGARWRKIWPEPTPESPPLLSLEQIPRSWWGRSPSFQSNWELVEANGRRRVFHVVGTDNRTGLGSGCSINLGLKTDIPNAAYQYGSVLVASRVGVLAPVAPLTSGSTERRLLSALLPAMFAQREAAAWKQVGADWRPSLTSPVSDPILSKAFMAGDEQGQYFYFESHREFERRPAQQGDMHSFMTGWLWRRSAASPLQLIDIRLEAVDADHKGARSFQPLGLVRHGSEQYWLGSSDSYAYSGLTVLRVRRNGVTELVLVDYGGC